MIDLKTLGGLDDDEYLDGDVIRCKKCGKERSGHLSFEGKEFYYRIECSCQKAKNELEKRIKENRKNANIALRYQDATFESAEKNIIPNLENIIHRCHGYCLHASAALKNGWGIYLYGSRGTGKTHIASCVANELLNNGYEVLFTSFFEISKEIRKTFNKSADFNEADLIEKISSIDFLVIDDIGTESLKKNGEDTWIQERVYDVLNKRYNAEKPTIFTSNYSFSELVNDRGMLDKSVDRIMEMSTLILKFEGQSYRREKRKVDLPF